ncbi:MAG: small basic family protein [Anaerolineae bacterium]|jgi:small basic protein
MWWLPILGLLIGLTLGAALSLTIPPEYSRYTAMAILAALDSVIGAARAGLDDEFDNRIFLSGFFTNIVLAGGLTFLGDRLGVDLYIAAIVAFGVRLFNNLAIIRRRLLERRSKAGNTKGIEETMT